MIQILSGDLD